MTESNSNLCPDGFVASASIRKIAALLFEKPQEVSYTNFEKYIQGWSLFNGQKFFRFQLVGSHESFTQTLVAVSRSEPSTWRSFKRQFNLTDKMQNESAIDPGYNFVYVTRWSESDSTRLIYYRSEGKPPNISVSTPGSLRSRRLILVIKNKPWLPTRQSIRDHPIPEGYTFDDPTFPDFAIPYEHQILHGDYSWFFFRNGIFRLALGEFASEIYDPDDEHYRVIPTCLPKVGKRT